MLAKTCVKFSHQLKIFFYCAGGTLWHLQQSHKRLKQHICGSEHFY
jgi:hypothetical protein